VTAAASASDSVPASYAAVVASCAAVEVSDGAVVATRTATSVVPASGSTVCHGFGSGGVGSQMRELNEELRVVSKRYNSWVIDQSEFKMQRERILKELALLTRLKHSPTFHRFWSTPDEAESDKPEAHAMFTLAELSAWLEEEEEEEIQGRNGRGGFFF
jgi:hypothetical protein